MVLWFVGPVLVAIFAIFRDATLDYRVLAFGALLPDVIDGIVRQRMAIAHSVVSVVVLLFALMAVTIGRRGLRKRLLAVAIGMFGHLVLDGAWLETKAFWWPITRGSSAGIPSVSHGIVVVIVEEVLGAIAVYYFVRRFLLTNAARRRLFVKTGTLDPRLIAPEGNPIRTRSGKH
jgi:hypothetical protein